MPPPRPTSAETNLYSEGAEFLVLGNLLIRGIHATKAYTRFPGWDVLATDPATGRTVRIQVKARLATDFDYGFPIKNFDAEFVVVVALNRGYRYSKARSALNGDGISDPQFWIFPMPTIVTAAVNAPTWGMSSKVFFRKVITGWQSFENNWELILDQLRAAPDQHYPSPSIPD
jgi:hypothetical protein